MLSNYWSLHDTKVVSQTTLLGLEANADNWFHNIISQALGQDKGKQKMAATAIFLVLYLNSVSSVKASNCDAYQEIHLLANTSFSVNIFVKALRSEQFLHLQGAGFPFSGQQSQCFLFNSSKLFFPATFVPACKRSLCRRQGLLSIMFVDLVSLAPLL